MPEDFSTRELTEQELRFGYWFVTHKTLMKRILVVLLVLVNTWLWGYAGFRAVVEWGIHGRSGAEKRALLSQNFLSTALRDNERPVSLRASNVTVLSLGEDRYDFVASIENPNERWAAESAEYFFRFSDGQTLPATAKFLPTESGYVADLGFQSERRPQNAELVIADVRWRFLNPHTIPDVATFVAQRKNFSVDNIFYIPPQESGLGAGTSVSIATFDLWNNTAYNYWQVGFYVILYRGNQVVGVNFTTANQLKAGERREVEVRFFEPLGTVTKAEVVPVVDILNPDAYMPFTGDTGGT